MDVDRQRTVLFGSDKMGFIYTTAIKKLRALAKRIRIIPGGTSAGKTYGILPILIDRAIREPLLEISVVSESVPHLRKGALKDFLKIMRETGRYIDAHYNRTLLTYTFDNGSYIEFFSADQEDKVRGPRRNILYINECNNIMFETYHQLAIRTDMEIWLDFNPSNEFWVHTELAFDPDAETLVLTYKDNEGLSGAIVREIEKARTKAYYNPTLKPPELFEEKNIKSQYWHNWWRVYGLGMVGKLEGVVFDNYDIVDEIPDNARFKGVAIDFGYSNDPTVILACYELNSILYWDELCYRKGMLNSDISAELKSHGFTASTKIVADSSEPKSIAEINKTGFRILPAIKGPDSIKFGIDLIQQSRFAVTKRSTNMINELRKYLWDVDKSGKTLNAPIDDFNHAMDAMRYFVTRFMAKFRRGRKIKRKN